MSNNQAEEIVVVGRISRPYGIHGWLYVNSFTEPEENLAEYRPWMLGDQESSPAKWIVVNDLETQRRGGRLIARIDSAASRTTATAIVNQFVGVPKSSLPCLQNDQFYWNDILGSEVFNEKDDRLGEVIEVIPTNAHEILKVSNDSNEYLIPFVSEIVKHVEAGHRIRVAWELDWD